MQYLVAILVAAMSLASAVIVAVINNSGVKRLETSLKNQKTLLQQHIATDEENVKQVEGSIATLKRHSTENYQNSLWGRMRDKDLPLEERADAARKYIDANYNGYRKVFAQTVVDKYRDECLEKEV